MEALKTYTEHVLYPEDKIVEKKENLLRYKTMEVRLSSRNKQGFVYVLPDVGVESYIVDSTDNGKNKAIITMLSKAPEMLELLLKTVEGLKIDMENDKLDYGVYSKKDEELLKEINLLLNQIID